MSEALVRREHPRAKCIHSNGIYIVVAWDAFFSVGPLLGQGYSRDEAWSSAARPTTQIDMRKIDSTILQAKFFFRRHRGRRGKR